MKLMNEEKQSSGLRYLGEGTERTRVRSAKPRLGRWKKLREKDWCAAVDHVVADIACPEKREDERNRLYATRRHTQRAVRHGRFEPGLVRETHLRNGRIVAVCERLETRVLNRAIAMRLLRSLRSQVPSRQGIRVSLTDGEKGGQIGALHHLSSCVNSCEEERVVLFFDIKNCFSSIHPKVAAEELKTRSGAVQLCNLALTIIAVAHRECPNVSGCAQGLAFSSVLANAALFPMDETLANTGEVKRYEDNYAVLLNPGVSAEEGWKAVHAAVREMNTLGHKLEIHELQQTLLKPEVGFENPIEWLGVTFEGTSRVLSEEQTKDLIQSLTQKDMQSLRCYYSSALTHDGFEAFKEIVGKMVRKGEIRPSRLLEENPHVNPSPGRGEAQPSPQGEHDSGGPQRASRIRPGTEEPVDKEYREMLFRLPHSPKDPNGTAYDLVRAALERAAELADSSGFKDYSPSWLLTNICLDFLATNDFVSAEYQVFDNYIAKFQEQYKLEFAVFYRRAGEAILSHEGPLFEFLRESMIELGTEKEEASQIANLLLSDERK